MYLSGQASHHPLISVLYPVVFFFGSLYLLYGRLLWWHLVTTLIQDSWLTHKRNLTRTGLFLCVFEDGDWLGEGPKDLSLFVCVPGVLRKWIAWYGSHRLPWTAQHGCYEPNSGPLGEQKWLSWVLGTELRSCADKQNHLPSPSRHFKKSTLYLRFPQTYKPIFNPWNVGMARTNVSWFSGLASGQLASLTGTWGYIEI